jgi:CotH kinase protein
MGTRRDEFFAGPMYVVDVRGWPPDLVHPAKPLETRLPAPPGARLGVWEMHPHDDRPLPDPGPGVAKLLDVERFGMGHSGNRTLEAPKRSWAVELEDGDGLAGMERLVLKAMYNDPSQMREALAWRLFAQAGVPAPRHTYARFGVNGTYLGLFSVVEHVDRAFVRSRFGEGHARGNLFKVSCGSLGCGTLARRRGAHGEDDGAQYRSPDPDDETYRLKSYAESPEAESFDDLATLARALDGEGEAGGGRFDADAYADRVRAVFEVEPFLRWAGVNILAGSWDNYFATPANYYLYNAGRGPHSPDVVGDPYFHFIPWDYDNSFGVDYFGTQWQYTDLLDWPSNTEVYHRFNRSAGRSRIPLVTNLLANTELRRYYLDHLEHLLDTVFTVEAVDAVIGFDGAGSATGGLWDQVATSAYLESDTPFGWPATGRQFVNDEVYRAASQQQELRRGGLILGIHHYVRMRYDRAREQLQDLRRRDPSGSSGATFTVVGVADYTPVAVG